MKNAKYSICILLLLFLSCDYDRNNPVINNNINYTNIITNSAVRDFVIIENFSANNFHYDAINHSCTQGYDSNNDGIYEGITGEQDCIGFWCEWDGDSCNDIDRDVIAVANDEAGLFIYEIVNGEINPQEIYFRNLIEFAGDGEIDIELRNIYYAENHNTLYMLDKFEYIYNLYLPPVISDYNGYPYEHDCTLPSEETLEYLQCGQFEHATKFVVDENNSSSNHILPFEMFILYKENSLTDGSILEGEEYSEIRKYWYNNNPNWNGSISPVCDNTINLDSSCNNGEAFVKYAEDCTDATTEDLCSFPDVCYENILTEGGFRFNHDGCVTGVSGGVDDLDGFTVSASENAKVFSGFSWGGTTIPSGNGILTELSGDVTENCLNNFYCNDGSGSFDSDCTELGETCGIVGNGNICSSNFVFSGLDGSTLEAVIGTHNECYNYWIDGNSNIDVCLYLVGNNLNPSLHYYSNSTIDGVGIPIKYCDNSCNNIYDFNHIDGTNTQCNKVEDCFVGDGSSVIGCNNLAVCEQKWVQGEERFCEENDEICIEVALDCNNSLLSYNVTDLYIDGDFDRLFIANPSDLYNSINLYYHDPIGESIIFRDRMLTDKRINTVISNDNYMVTGMKDGGCYITLLNEYGISDNLFDKLHIADNFSVYDIYYDSQNNKLILACGSNGVLIYDWNGESLSVELDNHILSSYAYTAKTYNNKIIIGTRSGMEIFNLGD